MDVLRSAVAGVMVFIFLFIYPLYIRNRYGEVIEGKYQLYWMTALAGLAAALVLGLIWLLADLILYKRQGCKAFFAGFKQGEWKKRISLPHVFLLIFMAAVVISTLQSEYLYESVWGNEGRYSGAFLLLLYGTSTWIISRMLRFHQAYLESFLVSAMGVCLLGIADYFHWDPMEFKLGMIHNQTLFTSTFGNINVYTAFVDIAAGTAAALFVSARGKKVFWYYICMAVIFTAAIAGRSDNVYLAFGVLLGFLPFYAFKEKRGLCRYLIMAATLCSVIRILGLFEMRKGEALGEVIGLAGFSQEIGTTAALTVIAAVLWSLAIIFYLIKRKQLGAPLGKKVKAGWAVLLTAFTLLGIAVFLDADLGGHEERYGVLAQYLVFNDYWGTTRGFVWRFAMELYNNFLLIHKIFGYGPETFGILTTQYNGNTMVEMYTKFGVYYDNAHNAFLQYLVTIGAAGLLAYVLFTGSVIWQLVKKGSRNPAVMACIFGISCYLAQSVVNIELPAATPVFWTLMAVGLAAVRSENREKTEKSRHN